MNGQLIELNAKLVKIARTKPIYRFYALAGTKPPKPGLVRVSEPTETGIQLEIWEMGAAEFGTFVAAIPPPLGIGTLELDDGDRVQGFLVESYAVTGATDITRCGGWRDYLKSLK